MNLKISNTIVSLSFQLTNIKLMLLNKQIKQPQHTMVHNYYVDKMRLDDQVNDTLHTSSQLDSLVPLSLAPLISLARNRSSLPERFSDTKVYSSAVGRSAWWARPCDNNCTPSSQLLPHTPRDLPPSLIALNFSWSSSSQASTIIFFISSHDRFCLPSLCTIWPGNCVWTRLNISASVFIIWICYTKFGYNRIHSREKVFKLFIRHHF